MLDLSARQRLYVYLCAVFLTALLIGDTIGSKLFTVDIPFGFTTLHATLSVGAIWFPITFLLTDTINEFYGSAGARFVTFVGFFMAIFAFVVIFIARLIPGGAVLAGRAGRLRQRARQRQPHLRRVARRLPRRPARRHRHLPVGQAAHAVAPHLAALDGLDADLRSSSTRSSSRTSRSGERSRRRSYTAPRRRATSSRCCSPSA